MCEQCEQQLAYATKEFHGALGQYKEDMADGNTRGTEAERVHDLANTLADYMMQGPRGFFGAAWMLALCMERAATGTPLDTEPVAAQHMRGVDFRLVVLALNEKRSSEGREPLEPNEIEEVFDVCASLCRAD